MFYFNNTFNLSSGFAVPRQPCNVTVLRLTSASMRVTWEKLTLVELKGLGSYVIRYIRSDRKEQAQENVITVSWTESNITIGNLQPGVQYDITVAASNKRGTSCECPTLKSSPL